MAQAAVTLPPEAADLCDRCLGRLHIGAAGAEPQATAGAEARAAAGWADIAPSDCAVCEGAFEDLDAWLAAIDAALDGIQFTTFQIGTVFPTPCEQLEKRLLAAVRPEGEGAETIRTEANRLLAGLVAQRTGATVDQGRPDVALLLDTRFWTCTVRPNSLFIAGRYTKHRRDVPQTHWPCKRCQGTGCWECDDVGVRYAESVESAIADVLVPAFEATGASFHGAGREDIDALMLGTGRPFVLELHEPRLRAADLAAAEAAVNASTSESGVGVTRLRPSEKAEVVAIKAADYQKEYLAHCLADEPVTPEAVQAAADALCGVTLDQRTPERVSHRRADLVRNRTVETVIVETPPSADEPRRFSLRVLAESGTYIKETVNGDDGRTQPNFAGLIGIPTVVEYLDVVAILDEAPEDA
ncbi:MAG: tRNA pseudouridine(54/55) synthase Pus10 [Thermoplasmatota archaeon]